MVHWNLLPQVKNKPILFLIGHFFFPKSVLYKALYPLLLEKNIAAVLCQIYKENV